MATQWTVSRPQMELEESVVRRRAAVRTLRQQILVWSLRTLLNLLVLGLLGAAFYGIYWATGYTVQLQVRRARGFHPEISQYMVCWYSRTPAAPALAHSFLPFPSSRRTP